MQTQPTPGVSGDLAGDLLHTVGAFETGNLPRNDYWSAMQRFHLALGAYTKLVAAAGLARIEIGPSELYIVLGNGLKFRWQPEDIRTVPNILVNHGSYEPDELRLLTYIARNAEVVFDIGANIGWYSLHLSLLVAQGGGTVYAFEPVPSTYHELSHNIALNDRAGTVRALNYALGETEGTIQFYVPEFTGSVAASARPLFPGDSNLLVECQVKRLDDFASSEGITRLDLIKCDVEGSELFVLKGGLRTIAEHRPVIMLEMLRKWARVFDYHPNDIISLLHGIGYTCWSADIHNFVDVPEMTETCTQTNFLFLHADKHARLVASLRAGLDVERDAAAPAVRASKRGS